MDASVRILHNVFQGETFGFLIAMYFYLTGLSAGSFIISTLAYGFGIQRFKPLGKIGIVLATLLLLVAPLCLLAHAGKPLRAWHLFVYLNMTSPITWGSFLLTIYPINCIIYGYFMFKGNARLTKIFGLVGIPLALMVHGYTGFILLFGKARALWSSPIMPVLFLVSAMVSGIAMMIIVTAIKDRFFTGDRKINKDLIFELGKILGWTIVLDLVLVVCETVHHLVSHREAYEAAMMMLTGSFMPYFVGLENLLGKIVPLSVVFLPKLKKVSWYIFASILVLIGIFTMRCNVVIGGEALPLF